jgi:hypothetical protein
MMRLRAAIPHGHWLTTTFVAGLHNTGMVAFMVPDGPLTGAAFLASVEQVLVPSLRRGDVVILDNLPAHRRPAVCATIEAAGARLLHLPPYSPDLTRSRMPSPSSEPSSTRPLPAPSMTCGMPFETHCRASPQPDAEDPSSQPGMSLNDRILLWTMHAPHHR